MQLVFRKNSQRLKALNYFCKNIRPQTFDQALNALLQASKLISKSEESLRTPWVSFSSKYKATANKLRQEKTPLRC